MEYKGQAVWTDQDILDAIHGDALFDVTCSDDDNGGDTFAFGGGPPSAEDDLVITPEDRDAPDVAALLEALDTPVNDCCSTTDAPYDPCGAWSDGASSDGGNKTPDAIDALAWDLLGSETTDANAPFPGTGRDLPATEMANAQRAWTHGDADPTASAVEQRWERDQPTPGGASPSDQDSVPSDDRDVIVMADFAHEPADWRPRARRTCHGIVKRGTKRPSRAATASVVRGMTQLTLFDGPTKASAHPIGEAADVSTTTVMPVRVAFPTRASVAAAMRARRKAQRTGAPQGTNASRVESRADRNRYPVADAVHDTSPLQMETHSLRHAPADGGRPGHGYDSPAVAFYRNGAYKTVEVLCAAATARSLERYMEPAEAQRGPNGCAHDRCMLRLGERGCAGLDPCNVETSMRLLLASREWEAAHTAATGIVRAIADLVLKGVIAVAYVHRPVWDRARCVDCTARQAPLRPEYASPDGTHAGRLAAPTPRLLGLAVYRISVDTDRPSRAVDHITARRKEQKTVACFVRCRPAACATGRGNDSGNGDGAQRARRRQEQESMLTLDDVMRHRYTSGSAVDARWAKSEDDDDDGASGGDCAEGRNLSRRCCQRQRYGTPCLPVSLDEGTTGAGSLPLSTWDRTTVIDMVHAVTHNLLDGVACPIAGTTPDGSHHVLWTGELDRACTTSTIGMRDLPITTWITDQTRAILHNATCLLPIEDGCDVVFRCARASYVAARLADMVQRRGAVSQPHVSAPLFPGPQCALNRVMPTMAPPHGLLPEGALPAIAWLSTVAAELGRQMSVHPVLHAAATRFRVHVLERCIERLPEAVFRPSAITSSPDQRTTAQAGVLDALDTFLFS